MQNSHPPEEEETKKSEPITAKIRSSALVGLFVLALLYTAYFARDILIPMALAFLFSLILIPLVAGLARLRIPRPTGAAIVLALLLAGFGFGVYGLSGPSLHWFKQAPHAVRKLERMIHTSNGPLKAVKKTENSVKQAEGNKAPAKPAKPATPATPVKVVKKQATLMDRLGGVAPAILTGVGIAIVLLYFLLAASDSFLRSLAHAIPRWPDKRHAIEIAHNIQHHIARYLFTITLINLGVGLVDGFALWLIGMPNPILWGAMIAIFNFVPYLGALTAIVVLFLIALITFSHIGVVLAVPATVLFVAIMEGQFITPHIVGRRLSLSPVAVFIMIVVWGWLWGVVGAIIAVPFLACFKLLCEEIESLNPISDFLTSYYGSKTANNHED
jgi:predicted PurR-regulated permease PerM